MQQFKHLKAIPLLRKSPGSIFLNKNGGYQDRLSSLKWLRRRFNTRDWPRGPHQLPWIINAGTIKRPKG